MTLDLRWSCINVITFPVLGRIPMLKLTLLKPLLVADGRAILFCLLHRLMYPFYGNLTTSPVLYSPGSSSACYTLSKIFVTVVTMIYPPSINIFPLTPPELCAFFPGVDFFPHFFSRVWICVNMQIFVTTGFFVWCLFGEDGIEVHSISRLFVLYANDCISINIVHWNLAIAVAAGECLSYCNVLCAACETVWSE